MVVGVGSSVSGGGAAAAIRRCGEYLCGARSNGSTASAAFGLFDNVVKAHIDLISHFFGLLVMKFALE